MLKCVTYRKWCEAMPFLSKHSERKLYPHFMVKRSCVSSFKRDIKRSNTAIKTYTCIWQRGFVSCHNYTIGSCMTFQIKCNSMKQKKPKVWGFFFVIPRSVTYHHIIILLLTPKQEPVVVYSFRKIECFVSKRQIDRNRDTKFKRCSWYSLLW